MFQKIEKRPTSELPLSALITVFSVTLFWYIYWPSLDFSFRAEQWSFLEYYETIVNPNSYSSWLEVAFWTPFHDYRLLPLAYLLHYIEYVLFDGNHKLFNIFSLALYQINALICGILVAQLMRRGFSQIIITFTVVSLLPAALEITVWSFFSYKLLQVTILLSSLILLEKGLEKGSHVLVALSFILIFLSTLFYEATILVLAFHGFRVFYKNPKWWGYLFLSFSLLILYLISWHYFRSVAQNLGITHNLNINIDYIVFFESAINWISQSWILANSGLKLHFISHQAFSQFVTLPPSTIELLLIISALTLLFLSLELEKKMVNAILILLCILILVSAPVLIGRTITNGADYLSGFSMYAYHGVIFLGSSFSIFLGTRTNKESQKVFYKKILRSSSLVIFLLLWSTSLKESLVSYTNTNNLQNRLINTVSTLITKTNSDVIVTARNTPFNTSATDINFFYSALKFLHPEKIFKNTEGLDSNIIVVDNSMVNFLIEKNDAGYEDLLNYQKVTDDFIIKSCEKVSTNNGIRTIISSSVSKFLSGEVKKNCLNNQSQENNSDIFVIDLNGYSKTRDVKNFVLEIFLEENYKKWNTKRDPILELYANVPSHPAHPEIYLFDDSLNSNWSTVLSDNRTEIELKIYFPNKRSIKKVTLHPRDINDNFFVQNFDILTTDKSGNHIHLGTLSNIKDTKSPASLEWVPDNIDNIIMRSDTVESKYGNKYGLQISEIEFE